MQQWVGISIQGVTEDLRNTAALTSTLQDELHESGCGDLHAEPRMATDVRMRYLALGDSLPIDKYTGEAGGGAASQLARHLGRDGEFVDLMRDGQVTNAVLRDLARLRRTGSLAPDLVTLTIGGNDFLKGVAVDAILANVETIAGELAALGAGPRPARPGAVGRPRHRAEPARRHRHR
jgi:lysophospholipase L1-like esterase